MIPTDAGDTGDKKTFEPQGSFSLKPVGRKKSVNWKIVGVIGGAILMMLIITVVFSCAVINNRGSSNETEVDEGKVKAELIPVATDDSTMKSAPSCLPTPKRSMKQRRG